MIGASPSYGVVEVELPPIIVTATRSERRLPEVPASVSVVTSEQIQNTPARTLDDILRRVPSIDLPTITSDQTHPTADNISLRGLGGIRALVLLDGVPLNDPFFGYVQWERVPLDAIERVEVVRGGGATLWGNYAMGGVINIITRATKENKTIVQGGMGNHGTARANGFYSVGLSDRFRLALDYGYDSTGGYQASSVRAPIDVPTSFTAQNFGISGNFDWGDGLSGRLRATYHENTQDLHTQIATNNQQVWTGMGSITKRLASDNSLSANIFHTAGKFTTNNSDTPVGATPGQAEFLQNAHATPVHDTGSSVVWTRNFAGWFHSFTAGADLHQIQGRDNADIFDSNGALIRTDVGRGKQLFAGTFGEVSLKPADPFEIVASGRGQYFLNYGGFDGSPNGAGSLPDRAKGSFDPRLSLRYVMTPRITLRAAGYEAFRAPTLDNLYRSFSNSDGIFFGNSALEPETLNGGEAGIDYTVSLVRTQVTGYFNSIRNLITSRNLSPSELPPGFFFGSRLINAGAAQSWGLEDETSWIITPKLSGLIGYTYAVSQITDNPLDPASIGQQQANIPRHKISAGITYAGNRGWHVTPQVRWISRTWGDNDHTLPIDEHFIADLSGDYPITSSIKAFLQIQNVFDRRYVADNSGFTLSPILGTPFEVFGGLRMEVR